MKKCVFSLLLVLTLCLTLLPVTVLAEETTQESETMSFSYAYDAQRSPAYPSGANTEMTFSGLKEPYVAAGSQAKSQANWTLTRFGTYSYYKSSGVGTDTTTKTLNSIVDRVAQNYQIKNPDTVVIHELKQDGAHICYGVVIAYDSANGYAGFLGDTLNGSAGYLLSVNAVEGTSHTLLAGQIATDFVKENTYGIALDSQTLDFPAADAGYGAQAGKTVTVSNTGNAATGALTISVSNQDFTVDKNEIASIALSGRATFTVTPAAGLSAGDHTATVTVSGPNIVSQTVTVRFTVNGTGKQEQAALHIEGADAVSYGQTLTLTAVGGTTEQAVRWTVDHAGMADMDENGVLTPKKAGKVTVTAVMPGDETYYEVSAAKEITIRPADITVKVDSQSAYVKDPCPANSYTVTGLVGEDQLTGTVVYRYYQNDTLVESVDMTKAGTYTIKAGGLTADGEKYNEIRYEDGTLTVNARSTTSGGGGSAAYPVNTSGKTVGGSVSSNLKNASKGTTVTITVQPESGYQLEQLTAADKNGNTLKLTDKGNGVYTFTMPAGKVEVTASFAKAAENSPFGDVSAEDSYYEAVKWAAAQGITGGDGNGQFRPDAACTRAQMVTFLWRAAGSPAPKGTASFADVPANAYYAKAVAWAVENGITLGVTDTAFQPNAVCTRAQGMTFLFRASKGSAAGSSGFRDVADNAYYAEAVKWAVDHGITNGIGGGRFGSDNTCTRAQMVTFLWRLYAGK